MSDLSSVREERWITVGFAENGRLLVVCHTLADGDYMKVRIISARTASVKERRQYEEAQ